MPRSQRFRLAALLALASLALVKLGALTVCPAGRCQVLDFDAQWLGALASWRTPLLDDFFRALSWAGSLYVLLPLAVALALLDRRAASLWQRAFLPLALVSQWPAVHVAKLLIARPRPNLYEPLIAMPADGSFPSAHAAQITAFACAWLLRPGRRAHPGMALILTVLVLGVALSRPYLQVHYPSDVLFAMASTVLWVMALRYALDSTGSRP